MENKNIRVKPKECNKLVGTLMKQLRQSNIVEKKGMVNLQKYLLMKKLKPENKIYYDYFCQNIFLPLINNVMKKPITTILSLEAMATSSESDKIHIPLINARRGYVFFFFFYNSGNSLLKPQHIKITELLEKIDGIGEYEIITNDEFSEFITTEKYTPDILKIVKKYKDKSPDRLVYLYWY